MKTLYLLRHAKSSWSDAALNDRERPLSKRGRKAATQMGRYIRDAAAVPDLIFCSPAERTRETLKRVAAEWDRVPSIIIEEHLYEFSAGGSYLALIRGAPPDATRLMLIGHNPTMEMLAAHLVGNGDARAMEGMEKKYPTCALAELAFEIENWVDVREGGGHLEQFVIPREVFD